MTDIACSALFIASAQGMSQRVHAIINSNRTLDINHQTESGMTSLMAATIGGYIEVVSLLLCHGADYSIKDKYGHDIMYYARQCKNPDIAPLLSVLF
ncbi:ankyrin repeat domain-containing protein 60 [Fadolivirus algeromassiliense]|jgi:ankyrin repeat protein|uniref:Ankyrin repeat domain-containing protein 60 n=1 Tax=Fadolivirus FV1/VV64 TaxID=3070911 RepID=A0A7D3QTP1_9VIRU|nr:ankyrin repeat domain-containing protein 60 [Fadolivirus algeromassiliense]QKF93483.1 ankyrin repeat domain-containing protein 60 [Fadolivirus FV1/VV64]